MRRAACALDFFGESQEILGKEVSAASGESKKEPQKDAKMGKLKTPDQKKGKSTLISLIGYKKTYKYAKDLKNNILRKLSKHGRKAKYLMSSVEFILGRKF